MPNVPQWELPKNLAKALSDGDGCWEDKLLDMLTSRSLSTNLS